MTTRFGGAVVLALALLFGGPLNVASAAVLDSFSFPAGTNFLPAARGGPNPVSVNHVDGSILGGARTFYAQVGPLPDAAGGGTFLLTYGGGNLDFNSSGANGTLLTISYGTAAAGGVALGNLTALGTGFQFDFAFLDTISPTDPPMQFDISANGGASTYTGFLGVNPSPFSIFVPFASFSNPGIFSNVSSLVFTFNTTQVQAADFAFLPGGINITQEIPEPASLLLWGFAAVSGGVLAYRRRQRAAA